MKMRAYSVVLAVMISLLGIAKIARAEDPLVIAPDKYAKLFENEKVRVLDLVIKPGESIAMHSHPDHFVCIISGSTLHLSHPDGTEADITVEAGQVVWIPAESHATVNSGTTVFSRYR